MADYQSLNNQSIDQSTTWMAVRLQTIQAYIIRNLLLHAALEMTLDYMEKLTGVDTNKYSYMLHTGSILIIGMQEVQFQ